MSKYISSLEPSLRIIDKMSIWRLLLVIVGIILAIIAWNLPAILEVAKTK